MVVCEPESKFEKIKRKFYLRENRISVNFELSKDAYFLRIRHKIDKNRGREIFFNGIKFTANIFHYRRERADFETSYIHLPKEIVKKGKNSIDISFFNNPPPPDIYVTLGNYRKHTGGGTYILFSDSAHLPTGKAFLGTTPFTNILILLSWIIAYFLGRGVFVSKDGIFLYCQRYLLLLFFALLTLFLAGWISANSGYRVVLTPYFFWESTFIILTPFFAIGVYKILKRSPIFFSKAAEFCFTEKKFNIRISAIFAFLIIILNLWVYWPSFSHLFRHDEWFLFFVSKEEIPNLQMLIGHIDWQLRIPVDRLVFRPLSRILLTLNRVIFDVNYVGPHIITFIKHISATFCLWWLMWQCSHRWVTGLFALLFSVLVVSVDPVVCPHFDVYIMTTIFTILAVITFHKTIYNQLSVRKGFALTALLLFLNLLTIELGFLLPICFFLAYWVIFRDRRETEIREKDRCSWFVFLLPMFLWGVLFSIHLYFAYPNFAMTSQSDAIGLWMPFVNVGRFILTLISGICFPVFVRIRYLDKVYFRVFGIGVVLTILLIFFCIRFRRKIFRTMTKETIFALMLLFSVLVIFCFGRASYVHATLKQFMLVSGYAYCAGALIIFVIYTILDFNKILQNRKCSLLLLFILAFLIVNHAFKTRLSATEIQGHTEPLRTYFDSVKDFVAVHKDEADFSFKIIDRPPKITVFPWYHETCIDSLFHRYIDNQKPKYLLEYDYDAENLKYSIYNQDPQPIISSREPVDFAENADYVNPLGIQFKKVSGQGYDFLVGMFEVTQKQWQDVMGYNPSRFKDDSRPVENVSYNMVQEFIKRLNEIEGGNLYRLPTEKEYLYLLDLLITNPGGQEKNIGKYAWFKDNADAITHPVGSLAPIVTGLYDVIGNVWEWTENPIDYDSEVKPLKDNPHICFGGSWREGDTNLYDLKTNYPQDFRHEHLGFRLVREIRKNEQDEIY